MPLIPPLALLPMLSSFFTSFRVYGERRLLFILAMGLVSGIPLYLVVSTIAIWLTEAGVALAAIGLFTVVGTPWNLKFLWAPFMDSYGIPGLERLLGRRKSWMLVTQLGLMGAVGSLALLDPMDDVWLAALAALAIAFFSASQDIVIDAYRIAILKPSEQGAGAAVTQAGYRLGGLIAGAGALFLADSFSWELSFLIMAATFSIGILASLLAPVPDSDQTALTNPPHRQKTRLGQIIIDPFAEFMRRQGWKHAFIILGFIVLYKFGDAFAGVMANPFYVKIGFTKSEIATVSKLFGVGATLLGVFLGGMLVFHRGAMPALIICGILQMLSNLMFVWQAEVGARIDFLFATIGIENLSGGMGSAAFVAYLSLLCNKQFAGTQFALLTSIMALGRTFLATPSGILAEILGWSAFFALSSLTALPGILLAVWMSKTLPLSTPAPKESL